MHMSGNFNCDLSTENIKEERLRQIALNCVFYNGSYDQFSNLTHTVTSKKANTCDQLSTFVK